MREKHLAFPGLKANSTAHQLPDTSDASAAFGAQDRIPARVSKDPKVINVGIRRNYYVAEENPPKFAITHARKRTVEVEMARNDNSTLNDIPPYYDRESTIEIAKENIEFERDLDRMITALDTTLKRDNTSTTVRQHQNDPVRAEEYVSLFNLETWCTQAALDTFPVDSYFAQVPTTPDSASAASSERDIIASESLAWQLDSFQSAENTRKKEQNIVDIDVVVSESQEETDGGDKEANTLSMLNALSFAFTQMDDQSICTSNEMSDQFDDDESKNKHSVTATEKADDMEPIMESGDHKLIPSTRRFSIGIANMVKHRKGLNSIQSKDEKAAENKPIRRFAKSLGGNVKKLNWSRTCSTSLASSSTGESVSDRLYDDNSSILLTDDVDISVLPFVNSEEHESCDTIASFHSSRVSCFNSPTSMGSELYEVSSAIGSSYESEDCDTQASRISSLESSTSMNSQVYKLSATIDSNDESIAFSDDDKSEPDRSPSGIAQNNHNSSKEGYITLSTHGKINNLEKMEQEAQLYICTVNTKPKRRDRKRNMVLSIANNMPIPATETFGLEVIAHPEMLLKYN